MSDRDGDYAWEMQNARGNYASDMQQSRYNGSIDPLADYQSHSARALDDWHNNEAAPSNGKTKAEPSSLSTSEGWPWERGGASDNGLGSARNIAGDQNYFLKRVAKSPRVMLGIPFGLATFFLFQALVGNSKMCLFLAATCLMITVSRARNLYLIWRARTDSMYGCPVITPGQVLRPQGASDQFDPAYGCPVITPGQVIPPPSTSHVHPNTTPMPTTGAPVVSIPPSARPRTTQGNVHILPPSSTA